MGRKSNLDSSGLTHRIIKMSRKDSLTAKQISDILQAEGLSVSIASIQRKIKLAKDSDSDFIVEIQDPKELIDEVRQNPNTDDIEACITLLARKIFGSICQAENVKFANSATMSAAVSKLATAQVNIAKLRLTYENGFEDAKKTILSSLREEVKAHPEILEKLTLIVTSLKAKEKK
jgi:hypothetical protein